LGIKALLARAQRMIVYQKKLLRIAEYWSGEEPQFAGVDLVRCFQQPRPVEEMLCREFYTIFLDLKLNLEGLWSGIKRGTRYEIRRAGNRDQLMYDCRNGSDEKALRQFSDYYDAFAIRKVQPKLDRAWLSLLARNGSLSLSQVSDSAGETLVWHCYHRSPHRATLFYSASLFRNVDSSSMRNMIGRANRFQHWQDIQKFKTEGVPLYDFGGWYHGKGDLERLRINKFKEEFGGEVVKNYICERALTTKAKLFLGVRRLVLGEAI
jgi:hypothetical protein